MLASCKLIVFLVAVDQVAQLLGGKCIFSAYGSPSSVYIHFFFGTLVLIVAPLLR